jgi:hypothetical protein
MTFALRFHLDKIASSEADANGSCLSVILATWEAEIGKTAVPGQSG